MNKYQNEIEKYHYWDSRIIELKSNFFGDELILAYIDNDFYIYYKFKGCFKTLLEHDLDYEKIECSKMTLPEIPYFIQDIEITEITLNNKNLQKCKINMYPLTVELLCNEIEVFATNELLN